MVEIKIADGKLIAEVLGIHKVWALKSRLEIPLQNIQSVRKDAEHARRPRGLRAPGTYIPGLITAGTYYYQGKPSFWDVCRVDNAIVIELANERYSQLVLEVADPDDAVRAIEAALP